jgi:hypothetical protein
MTKKEAIQLAKAMRTEGREVKVFYQTLTHANPRGPQRFSLVYRLVENGAVIR